MFLQMRCDWTTAFRAQSLKMWVRSPLGSERDGTPDTYQTEKNTNITNIKRMRIIYIPAEDFQLKKLNMYLNICLTYYKKLYYYYYYLL